MRLIVSPLFCVIWISCNVGARQTTTEMARPPYHLRTSIRYDPMGQWDHDWERMRFTHTGTITFLLDRNGPGPRAFPIPIPIPMILSFPYPPGVQIIRPPSLPLVLVIPPLVRPLAHVPLPLPPHIAFPVPPPDQAPASSSVPLFDISPPSSSSVFSISSSSFASTGRKRTADEAGPSMTASSEAVDRRVRPRIAPGWGLSPPPGYGPPRPRGC